ncbi:MAG: PAS domain S-box protein [Magnetospirillum sp.]|nr:PAS domain S-box protein [Magnetospirillum sp.]
MHVYWDLVLVDAVDAKAEKNLAIPLLELMKRAGFTASEFGKLAEAKANSDQLTATEFEAMALVESGVGANRAKASGMLHDEAYHQAKAAIMRPINEFFVLVDNRTLAAVRDAEDVAMMFRIIFIFFIAAALLFIWRTYRDARATLGGSVDDIHAQITRIGQGDFSSAITVAPGTENSVLAGLAEMQAKLNALEAQRGQAEAKLVESESFLRAVIENEPECIKILDVQGCLIQMNPAGLAMIEADSFEQVAGRSVLDLIAPEHRHAFEDMHQRVLAGEAMQMEFEVCGLKGGRRWMETHAVPMRDRGQVVQLAVTRDITARKHAETMLQHKNEALARSNAELEAFAYVASHDLREPLRNVTAFSTMLARRLEGRLQDDEGELIKIVIDGATRMDALVRDLLEVSRVGQGEQPMQPVALAPVIAAALDSLKVQIGSTGATVDVPHDLPVVMGNGDELYRVFLNIIGNALKYRQDSPPLIRIDCGSDGMAAWRFQIQDNGIGMETGQGYEERVFGLFQRLHQRDDYGGGTGIGLPICRKIINRHGGRIWVESDGVGKGVRFIFTLPA